MRKAHVEAARSPQASAPLSEKPGRPAGLFMLFVIWLLRRYHSLAQKMILSLTVAAFFDSVAYVMLGNLIGSRMECRRSVPPCENHDDFTPPGDKTASCNLSMLSDAKGSLMVTRSWPPSCCPALPHFWVSTLNGTNPIEPEKTSQAPASYMPGRSANTA
ncbi:hypothetical protein EYF80_040897 [Liparis tanakae]|uniref:Uncharacterized protein n=1 Tax=Liparis tanakae TaxID=230148 RepID=A0A4Z2G717_9TELE|nr:hypothetical protein EYF80_040897 [Liparis tanakae]